MDSSFIQFRKTCQFYHTKIKKLLKKGDIHQAKELINKVGTSLSQWEDRLRSDRQKVQLLKNIYADLVTNEKRASYKRRQENNDSE